MDTLLLDLVLDSTFFGQFLVQDFPIEVGPFEGDSLLSHQIALVNTETLCSQTIEFQGVSCIENAVSNPINQDIISYSMQNKTLKIIPQVAIDKLQLFNMTGQLVLQSKSHNLQLANIPTGIYIVNLKSNSWTKAMKIFIP